MSPFLSLRRGVLAAAAVLGLVASSCKKDEPNPAPSGPGTITQVASANADLSILAAAVVKTGLDANLNGAGPFTVFAPNNTAFQSLPAPFNSAASITAITDQNQINTLRGILQYHVLAANPAVTSAAIANGQSTATTIRPATANTNDNVIYLSKNSNGVFINGNARVLTPDVAASNGIVHIISQVLMPPSQTLAAIVIANPNTTILEAALLRPDVTAALGTLGLGNLLTPTGGSGNFTVFVPTDAAFNAAGITITSIVDPNQVPLARLAAILSLHVVNNARVFSPDVPANGTVSPIAGSNTLTATNTFNASSGNFAVTLRGNGNTAGAANVTTANVLATNGVAHIIDRVLLP